MKKHLNETKFASKISTSASILCTDIPASKIPSPENTRASTTKRNVETSSRQSWANKTNCKPPSPSYILAYIHENPIRRKFQIIRGGRRKIYIYRDREYRFRATSIMEDSVQGSAIILQHPPLEPRPPRPLSSVIQSVYIYICSI